MALAAGESFGASLILGEVDDGPTFGPLSSEGGHVLVPSAQRHFPDHSDLDGRAAEDLPAEAPGLVVLRAWYLLLEPAAVGLHDLRHKLVGARDSPIERSEKRRSRRMGPNR